MTTQSTSKAVLLPFLGWNESVFNDYFYEEIEREKEHLSEELQAGRIDQDEHDGSIKKMQQSSFKEAYKENFRTSYKDYLEEKLEEHFGLKIDIGSVAWNQSIMTNTNNSGVLATVIDLEQLPKFETLEAVINKEVGSDIREDMQREAIKRTDFYSLFRVRDSNADLTEVFNKPYEQWEADQLAVLIAALVQAVKCAEKGNHSEDDMYYDINDFEVEMLFNDLQDRNQLAILDYL